jgi:hypothetical protein
VIELDTDLTHGAAWAQRNDAERDASLARKGNVSWRVRPDFDSDALAALLRQRLAP